MKHHRLGLCAFGLAAALLASTAALAGFRTVQPVVIADSPDRGYPFANGDLGYAATTNDSVEYIGCYTYNGVGGCNAVDRTGLTRSCATADPTMIAIMRSLRGDSYLTFHWDTNGQCTNVSVENTSSTLPKT